MQVINSLYLIYLISFTDLFAVGLTFPLINPHLRKLGATHGFIGFLASVYSGLQVISGPIIGSWTDLKGRKYVLKKVLLLCGLCYGLLGLTNSFFLIFILRVILGCVKHIQSICKASITDILPENKHSAAFGQSMAIAGMGFILGPLIGGHISELSNGFTYVCLFTSGLFFFNIFLVSLIKEIDGKKKDSNTDRDNLFNSAKMELTKSLVNLKEIKWQEDWQPFFLRFLFGMSTSAYFSNQSLILSERYHLSPKHSGYIISFFSTIGTISTFFLNYFNRWYKNRYVQKLSNFFAIMAASIIVIYIMPNFYVFLLALIPFAVSNSSLRIYSMEIIIEKNDVKHKGALSGVSSSIMSIARFITPFLTGILADKFGEGHVLLISIVPALIAVFLTSFLITNRRYDCT